MKKSTLRIKKYLFLTITILSLSSVVACLNIYFCIFEKSKEFRKNIGEIEPTVISLRNEFYPERISDKRLFMKYEDILEITRRCKYVSRVIIEYSRGAESSEDIILLRNKKESNVLNKSVSPGYDKLVGLTMKEGRFLRKEDEESEVCVILQSLAKKLEAKVSDKVRYMGKELKIIGIVAERKPFDINITHQDIEVYFPIKIKRQLHENEKIYTEEAPITVSSEKVLWIVAYLINYPEKRELAHQEATNLLEDKYGKEKKFSVGEANTFLLGLKFYEILWYLGLFFIIGISLLINKKCLSMFLSLTYKNQPFLVKTCLLTGIGGLLGIVFGWNISYYLMLEPKISILSIFVSLSIGLIFNLLIAIRTAKKLKN